MTILRVEQPVAAHLETRDEVHERDLRGIARAMEHAFAEKGAAERHAVQSANKIIAVVDLYRVAVTAIEQRSVDAADADIDPGARAVLLGFGAAFDDSVEVAVDMDRITRGADSPGEAARKVEPLQGITPRMSGSIQYSAGSSALSAIGKIPQAYAFSRTSGVISMKVFSRFAMARTCPTVTQTRGGNSGLGTRSVNAFHTRNAANFRMLGLGRVTQAEPNRRGEQE